MTERQDFIAFQDALNRTLNKTVSQARLRFLATSPPSGTAAIGYIAPGARNFTSVPLQNGYHLGIRIDVSHAGRAVTTLATSISYRRSAELRSDDWIFRYEYERDHIEEYPYPTAHLHVNAHPEHYRGTKPFPDLHLPTRRLSLEEIIRHLIVEHNVPTLGPKQVALDFLIEQQDEFERRRTDLGIR